jgi:hypothetical protein
VPVPENCGTFFITLVSIPEIAKDVVKCFKIPNNVTVNNSKEISSRMTR